MVLLSRRSRDQRRITEDYFGTPPDTTAPSRRPPTALVLVRTLPARVRDRHMPRAPIYPRRTSFASGHVEAMSLYRLQWQYDPAWMVVGDTPAGTSRISRHT